MKEYIIPEEVAYWKWMTDDTLAVITKTYSIHIKYNCELMTIFLRHVSIQELKICDYNMDETKKWMLICCYKNDKTNGKVQLYSVQRKLSQLFDAELALFAVINGSILLCAVIRDEDTYKLFINPLETTQQNNQQKKRSRKIDFSGDIPIAMHIIYKSNFIVVLVCNADENGENNHVSDPNETIPRNKLLERCEYDAPFLNTRLRSKNRNN